MFTHEREGLLSRKVAYTMVCMDGWGRVITAVVDRRAELGWTQKELAGAAGVSERTVQNLEGGVRPQARNRHKIERALGWPNGEMRRIEAAEEPPPPPPPRLSEETKALMREELGPELAAQLIAHAEHLASGRLPPAARGGPAGESGSTARRSAG